MLLKFGNFIKESIKTPTLHYAAFDWDDNILYMPTVIHMEHLIDGEWIVEDVSTSKFAEVRGDSENWRLLNNDPSQAFSEFRDNGPRGESAFSDDLKLAIKNGKYGPAWDDFIECLTNGSLLAIITARGHESDTMRSGVEWIIDNLDDNQKEKMHDSLVMYLQIFKKSKEIEDDYDSAFSFSKSKLVKNYLDLCEFVGVSAPSRGGSPSNPEKAKEDALLQFIEKINKFANSIGWGASIGFSDDDLKNVKHIENLIDEIHHEEFSSLISFVVKGTKDPENITKKVRVFKSILNFKKFCESQDPLQTSTISMQTPNAAMSGEIDSNEPFVKQRKKQVEVLNKLKSNALKDKKK